MAEEKTKEKQKRPSALKSHLQSEKRRLVNRAFKSRIRTSLRSANELLEKGEAGDLQKALSEVCSFMDKGVKRGIFKQGKADRVKSRFAAKIQQTTAA